MKRLLIFLSIAIWSCNSNKHSSLGPLELNGLEIDSAVVADIARLANKTPEKNSAIRYEPANSTRQILEPADSTWQIFEQFDSLSAGVRFRFVRDETAYRIIDKYFQIVKKSQNYLFLTNLDFDDSYKSYYDIVIAPVSDQFELIRFVGTEPVNYGLSNDDVIEWFKMRRSEFDFDIIVADLDRIEARIKSDPRDFQKLGQRIYEFCPDVIDQGHSDMDELVEYLESSKHMWFWWD